MSNLAAPPPGQGFPVNYPYAQSQPLPSAILRPLQQPLYDTEYLPTTAIQEVIFFQRQLGQTTTSCSVTKSDAETNLQQPGQLANPLEFSLFGFLFEVAPLTTAIDYSAVYKGSAFYYTYTGNRVYLQIPLSRIPQGLGPVDGGSAVASQTASTSMHNGVEHISNLYKFTIGRSALRIRPTESFQSKVRWPNKAPVIVGLDSALEGGTLLGVRMRVFLVGLSWTALTLMVGIFPAIGG